MGTSNFQRHTRNLSGKSKIALELLDENQTKFSKTSIDNLR